MRSAPATIGYDYSYDIHISHEGRADNDCNLMVSLLV